MNGLRAILQTNNISGSTADERVGVRLDRPDPRHAPGGPSERRRARPPGRLDQLHERLRDLGPGHSAHTGGRDVFGTPINVLEAPFLHGVTIVEAPLLRPYTAIALTSSEVYIRNKRNPYWNLRGNRGDMVEGDWIAEMAIEVVNESITPGSRGSRRSPRTNLCVRGQWSVVALAAVRRGRTTHPRPATRPISVPAHRTADND